MLEYKKYKNTYTKDGVIVIKNFFSKKKFEKLFKIFQNRLAFNLNLKYLTVRNNFNDEKIHLSLTRLRKKNPKKFSHFYDSLQECNALNKIFLNSKLESLISYLINSKDFGLSISGKMLRMDSYFDNKSSYDWHQDYPYYLQNKNASNGCVVFFPLHKIDRNLGALEYIKGSHLSNELNHYKDKETNRLIINSKKLHNNKIDFLEYNVGDVAIMHLNLIHRSGKNNSNKFRLTAGARFHNTISSDFTSFRSEFKLSD